MKKFKFIKLTFLFLFILASCADVKSGLTGSKKDNKDEFLVQKKNPLVQPPNFNDLPKPARNRSEEGKLADNAETDVEKLFEDYNIDTDQTSEDTNLKTIEDSILEKINEN